MLLLNSSSDSLNLFQRLHLGKMVEAGQLLLLLVNAVLVTSTTLEVEINALQSLYNSANGINWGWRDVILFAPKWNFSQYQESINPCSDNGVVWQGLFLFDRFVNNYFMNRIAMLSRL
jgi:hypothetical protein